MAWLDFDPGSHAYRLDGVAVPSVTQVLMPLYDWSGIPRHVLLAAAERGTAVHKACELFDLDLLDEGSLDQEVAGYLAGWKKFLLDSGFVPERVEQRVASCHHQYAGTLDRSGRLGRRKALLDIKSGVVSPVTGPQTAAYGECVREQHSESFSRRLGVYLRPGDYVTVRYDDDTDWTMFRSALNLRNWRVNNGLDEIEG